MSQSQLWCQSKNAFRLVTVLVLVSIPLFARAGERIIAACDTSSSMDGSRIKAAREGLKLLAAIAEPDDELVVVSFNTSATSQVYSLQSQNDRDRAMKSIDELVASGNTDYLSALKTPYFQTDGRAAFFSDGEHRGGAQEVKDFMASSLPSGFSLSTIGIECQPQGAAESLLVQMASLSGGNYSRADTSESVVKRFVELGVRNGAYRSHQPVERTLVLKRAVGRVLAFAYDADVSIHANQPLVTYRHVARLPGESVTFTSVVCDLPTDIEITLQNPQSSAARLGDVYIADLPSQDFQVDLPSGLAATGTVIQASFGFSNPQGHPVSPSASTSAHVDVVDAGGRVVKTVQAVPSQKGRLEASIQMPATEGAVTLRGSSNWDRDGRIFSQSDERTILVQSAPELVLSPQRITGSYPRGRAFRIPIKTSWKDTGLAAEVIKAELVQPVDGLRLQSTTITAMGADLHFLAGRSGTIHGSIKFSASRDGIGIVEELPFEFVITPDESGLQLPAKRRIELPETVSGDSGAITIEFPTQDNSLSTYTLAITDASSESSAVPMSLDINEIQAGASMPGRAKVSWNTNDAPSGTYRATVTASTLALPDQDWVTELILPVIPALSAAAIDVHVGQGQTTQAVVAIQNRSSVAIKGLTLETPNLGDEVFTNIKPSEFLVPAMSSKDLPVEFLLNPLYTEFGTRETTINVAKEGQVFLRVPLKVTIDPAAQPAFRITPSPVRLGGSSGEVLQFKLLVRSSNEPQSATTLTASIGSFSDEQTTPTLITASVVVEGTNKLRSTTSTVSLKGIVVCPGQSGLYSGELEVSGSNGEKSIVPVHIVVK